MVWLEFLVQRYFSHVMKEIIQDDKFVELNYKITDQKTGEIIAQVNVPLGYVQGDKSPLLPQVIQALEGKSVGDKIDVPIDCTEIFGPWDKDLTFTDDLENVPEEYRSIGTKITMENNEGEPKDFFVTKIENNKLTVDGNNPLCGREVIFSLKIVSIRDATEAEIESGCAVEVDPNETRH